MYVLLYDRRIEKDLRSIPRTQCWLILHRLERLMTTPRGPQVRKLTGIDGYRLRVGDYQVLLTIDDRAKRVTVYRILHRRDAYR